MQFLKEQAALSAAEITADTVNDFIADMGDEGAEDALSQSLSGAFASSLEVNGKSTGSFSGDPFLRISYQPEALNLQPKPTVNGKVNGKHSMVVNELVLNSERKGLRKLKIRYIQDEARAGIEAWQTERISLWHSSGGSSVQWFGVCCHDRNSNILTLSFSQFKNSIFKASSMVSFDCRLCINRYSVNSF